MPEDAPQRDVAMDRHLRVHARVRIAGGNMERAVGEHRAAQLSPGRLLREDQSDGGAIGGRLADSRVPLVRKRSCLGKHPRGGGVAKSTDCRVAMDDTSANKLGGAKAVQQASRIVQRSLYGYGKP